MKIILVRAPDDARVTDPEMMKEIDAFSEALRAGGVKRFYIDTAGMAFDSAHEVLEFILKWTPEVASVVGPALIVWLRGRSMRKVSVEFHSNGKLKKVSAQTVDEVRDLMMAPREQVESQAPKKKEK
jgi:hypothetical protein